MPKACDLKKGAVVTIDDHIYIVKNIDVKSPSSRGAQTLYKTRFSRVPDGQKMDKTLIGDDMLQGADLRRTSVQLLYREGDIYTFMDTGDYSQHLVNSEILEEVLPYLPEQQDNPEPMTALIVAEQMIALELPATVVMPIEETDPAIKGASASARTKIARFSTGLEIQIPEYLASGEQVRINTTTGKYISRA
ncbi:MAG: elongation factor P-like protein YeiP [Motiliproteus sp.]